MSSLDATMRMQRNVDRLIRSLVGVIDYAISWDGATIVRLDLLKDASVEDHQLIRNVVSGLGAGCGLRLSRSAVRVETNPDIFASARAAATPLADVPVPPDTVSGVTAPESPASNGTHRPSNGRASTGNGANGNGNGTTSHADAHPRTGATNGNGRSLERVHRPGPALTGRAPASGSVPAASLPAGCAAAAQQPRSNGTAPAQDGQLRLERIELDNRGATLRCRVVLALTDHVYSAIAEVAAGPTAEADVAARVTLDALRAGALVCAVLDGVGFTTIGDHTYVVAAVRESGKAPRAGTAVIQQSAAHAAAAALLAALGTITTDHLVAAEQRLGSLNPKVT